MPLVTGPVVETPSLVDSSVAVVLGMLKLEELKKPLEVLGPDDTDTEFDVGGALSEVKGLVGTPVTGTEVEPVMGRDEAREELA